MQPTGYLGKLNSGYLKPPGLVAGQARWTTFCEWWATLQQLWGNEFARARTLPPHNSKDPGAVSERLLTPPLSQGRQTVAHLSAVWMRESSLQRLFLCCSVHQLCERQGPGHCIETLRRRENVAFSASFFAELSVRLPRKFIFFHHLKNNFLDKSI